MGLKQELTSWKGTKLVVEINIYNGPLIVPLYCHGLQGLQENFKFSEGLGVGGGLLVMAQKEEFAGNSQHRSQGVCGSKERLKWLFQPEREDRHL